MQLGIHQTAHNLIKNSIWGWEYSFQTSCKFADKVVIVVNKSEDGTREQIISALSGFDNYEIVDTEISTSDPWFDGKLKNIGLQHLNTDCKLQLDGDEVPYGSREMWDNYLTQFYFAPEKCLAVGSVNLFKDWSHFYSVTHKQYVSKGSDCFRGPVISARNPDGSINTTKSDGCDLILADGNFAPTQIISNNLSLIEDQQVPAILHYGYVNLASRIERNKKFWLEHWYVESNGKPPAHKIHLCEEDFDQAYIPCNLPLENAPKLF